MREYYWYTMDGLAYVALAVLVASIGMVVIVPKARRHIGVWFAAVGAWGFVVLNLPAQWMSVGPLLLLAGLAAFICLATLSFYKVFIAGEMQW